MLDIVDLFGGEDGNRTHHTVPARRSRHLGTCLPSGLGTRYWIRTSDHFRVGEALYR